MYKPELSDLKLIIEKFMDYREVFGEAYRTDETDIYQVAPSENGEDSIFLHWYKKGNGVSWSGWTEFQPHINREQAHDLVEKIAGVRFVIVEYHPDKYCEVFTRSGDRVLCLGYGPYCEAVTKAAIYLVAHNMLELSKKENKKCISRN